MPFIDAKITKKLTDQQKTSIKSKFGKAISIMQKPESFLMVGFEDGYDLFFAGKKLESGALVSVDTFGEPVHCTEMTAQICKILNEELDIPANAVYVVYRGTDDWGWNGRNF